MHRFLIAAAIITTTLTRSAFATDFGASVSVGQPGFYGHLDVGNFPQPQVIYLQPIAIEPVMMNRPPVYLHVPPGHAKHWRKHCHEYNACGERVLFVQDGWYNHEYVPYYQEQHGRGDENRDERSDDGGEGHKKGGHGYGHGQGHDRD